MRFDEFDENGFAVLKKTLDEKTVSNLIAEVGKLESSNSVRRKNTAVYGVRNLLRLSPQIRRFAESSLVRAGAEKILGGKAKIVRAIYFNKTPEANWKVPWHQDLTIAVREKRETPGFSPWTRKADVWHVQPPIEILEKMLTLRFHLDDADETNGALKLIPQSHRRGRLTATEIKSAREANKTHLVCVKQGDCLIMRPLILHSSSAGTAARNRRVLHFELAAEDLPNDLKWYDA